MKRKFFRVVAILSAVLLLGASPVWADNLLADDDTLSPINGNLSLTLQENTTGTVDLYLKFDCTGSGCSPLPAYTATASQGGTPSPAAWVTSAPAASGVNYTGWVSVAISVSAVGLSPDSYTTNFKYQAVDRGGNSKQASINLQLTVTAAPSTNSAPWISATDITVEGNTTGGATVAYTNITVGDAEDDPDDLTLSCTPASGSFFALGGPHTVSCTVTDSGGMTDTTTFEVTVQDTTPPDLVNMPGNRVVMSGTAVSWTAPTATDVVDPNPTVTCDAVSGDVFTVTTTVTCTATDASNNSSVASFTITVIGWTASAAGGGVYKEGSTIPIRYTVSDPSLPAGTLQAQKEGEEWVGDPADSTDLTTTPDSGNTFRWDPDSEQFILNYASKLLGSGTFSLRIKVSGVEGYIELGQIVVTGSAPGKVKK